MCLYTEQGCRYQTTARLMERAGTGGALFRKLYRDFLKESAEILTDATIEQGYKEFSEIAVLWVRISELFFKAGETKDIQYVHDVRVLPIRYTLNP